MWTSSLFNQFPLGGCLYCVQSLLVLLALQQQQQKALCICEFVLWGQIGLKKKVKIFNILEQF